jgi:hypothetical protein
MQFRIGATSGVVVVLFVIAFFGFTRLLALRCEGHPLADAWIGLF